MIVSGYIMSTKLVDNVETIIQPLLFYFNCYRIIFFLEVQFH